MKMIQRLWICAVLSLCSVSVADAQLWVSTSTGVTTTGKVTITSSAADALTVTGGVSTTGLISATRNENAISRFTMANTNAGSGAGVTLDLTNNVGLLGELVLTSSAFPGQNSLLTLIGAGNDGIRLSASHANGNIAMLVNAVERLRLSSTALTVTGVTLSVTGDTNGTIAHTLLNTSTGSSGLLQLNFANSAGTVGQIQTTSSGHSSPSDFLLLAGNTMRIIATSTLAYSGTTHTFTGGRINSNTSQPSVFAYNSADDSIGAGGTHTVDFDSELVDQANNFSADTFTAPITGRYLICTTVAASFSSGGYAIVINTSNNDYLIDSDAGTSGRGTGGCVIADMDTSDTAIIQVECGTSGTVEGSGSPYFTFLSIHLII
jgi:hypothetical protein